jgi:hypothetical protein
MPMMSGLEVSETMSAFYQNVSKLALFFIGNVCWLCSSAGNRAGFAAFFW